MPKSFKSPKSSMRSGASRGSKKSFVDSKWFYMLVAAVLLISAVFFFSMPLEQFTNPTASASKPSLEYFYMTTCPHCEEFSPIWDKAVTLIKDAGLNVTTHKHNINDKAAGEKRANFFDIKSAPTVLYVHGPQPTDKYEYTGPRTPEAILAYVRSKQ